MLQRFPLQVELEPEALRIANQYANYSNFSRPFLGIRFVGHHTVVQILLMSVFSYLVVVACLRFKHTPSKQASAQQSQNAPQQTPPKSPRKDTEWLHKSAQLLSQVTPAYVQSHFQSTQERFRNNGGMFLRHCINLS